MGDVFAAGRCHVISCFSGSGWLKHAAGLKHKSPIPIFAFCRLIYSAGPISGTTNPALYSNWCDQFAPGLRAFSGVDHEGHISGFEQGWNDLLAWPGPVTFWFSKRNVQEYSFYLGFLQRYPRLGSVDFVDVSNVGNSGRMISGTGECTPDLLDAAWTGRYRLSPADLKRELEKYSDHMSTADGVRAFENGKLITAPIEYHDAAILEQLDRDWVPLANVIGNLFEIHRGRDERQLEYFYLLWRVQVLAQSGRLDCIGDPSEGDLRDCRVRTS